MGAIYVDNRLQRGAYFDEEDQEILAELLAAARPASPCTNRELVRDLRRANKELEEVARAQCAASTRS